MSFRPKGEIFLRSLAFARDDGPKARHLATLRLGGSNFRLRVLSVSRSFAHAAQILNYSSTEFTESDIVPISEFKPGTRNPRRETQILGARCAIG